MAADPSLPVPAPNPRFERLFQLSPAPTTLSEAASGRIVAVNDAWLAFSGYRREELIGRTSGELGLIGTAERCRMMAIMAERGQVCRELLDFRTREGLTLHTLISAELLDDPAGPLLLTTLHDITPLTRDAERLERLTHLYAGLRQVNHAIVWSEGRQVLLDKVCEVMVTGGGFCMAWIGWNDPLSHEVAVLSQYGDQGGYLRGLRVRSDDSALGRGGTGTAIRTGKPVVLNDIAHAPDASPWHAVAARCGFQASASIPIRQGGTVVAALMVYARELDFFGAMELGLLEEAAGDLSIALDHMELDARRRSAEAALLASESQFRLLFAAAPIGMAIVDSATGRFLSVNPRLGEILGVAQEELLKHTFQEFTHPDHVPADMASILELARGEVPEVRKEKRYIHASGKVVWARLSMVRMAPDAAGGARHLSLVEDITEAHQAQEALRETLERLQKIADRVPGVVYQYRLRADGSSHMPFASEAIREVYRVSPEEVREDVDRLNALHHPEDHAAIQASIQASARQLTPWKHEFRLKFADGEVRTLYGDSVPEREPDGATLWTGFITDITERKQFEARLQQAQKMESLGSLAGGIAHDMNNVLGAILGLSSACLIDPPEDPQTRQAFATIREAATRGGNVVKSLLRFARQGGGDRAYVDLNELLLEEARLLERTTLAKVRLELDLAEGLRVIHGDAGELASAIMNLCVNAVDAMAEGGLLTLRTGNLGADQVELEVRDTGCGMTGEVLLKAMDPFFTTKEVGKGTGLGLAMVYATLKAHHGRVELSSEPGRGTRVRLLFPAAVTRNLEPAEAPPPAAAAAGALRVLLVDDDELVLRSTAILLRALGHEVDCCIDGEAALERVAAGYRPEVVLLDMNMPGLGGKATLPLLRAAGARAPVLLATGRADQEALDLVAAHPDVFLLAKPYGLGELSERLARIQADRAAHPF